MSAQMKVFSITMTTASFKILTSKKFENSNTVGTPNKGQLIFWENGSNKGIFGIPLFAIFKAPRQIRDFSRLNPVEMALFDYKSALLAVNNFFDFSF